MEGGACHVIIGEIFQEDLLAVERSNKKNCLVEEWQTKQVRDNQSTVCLFRSASIYYSTKSRYVLNYILGILSKIFKVNSPTSCKFYATTFSNPKMKIPQMLINWYFDTNNYRCIANYWILLCYGVSFTIILINVLTLLCYSRFAKTGIPKYQKKMISNVVKYQ